MADSWSNLNPPLSKSTLDVLNVLGFNSMTPVQVKSSCVVILRKHALTFLILVEVSKGNSSVIN